MQLDQLVHWRLQGTPDVFKETWQGEQWLTISHGQPYDVGVFQRATFARPIKRAVITMTAARYTTGDLALRLGIDPTGLANPAGIRVQWSDWLGPDKPTVLVWSFDDLSTTEITVFLRATTGDWPTSSNVARFRDVQIEVEYADAPEPEPEPDPEPDQGILAEIEQVLTVVQGQLDRLGGLLDEWDTAQAWADTYNYNRNRGLGAS
jgi:hypothetical protein